MTRFTTAAVAALIACSTPAFAQDQEGLVNLSIDDNVVQVPCPSRPTSATSLSTC